MSLIKVGYAVEKMMASPTGRQMLKEAAVATAPVVVAAAPAALVIAAGGAAGYALGKGFCWVSDKLSGK